MFNLLGCRFGKFIIYQKYIVTLMISLCWMCLYGTRYALRFAVFQHVMEIEYMNATSRDRCADAPVLNATSAVPEYSKRIQWSVIQCGIIECSFYFSYTFGHFPSGILSDTIGARYILVVGTVGSSIVSAVMPYVVTDMSWYWCAIYNGINGLMQGICVSALFSLLAHWAPPSQTSLLISIAFGGGPLGNLLGAVLNSYFIHHLHIWCALFFFWSAALGVWTIFFLIFVFSTAQSHHYVSQQEKQALTVEFGDKMPKKIPWRKILKDDCTWAFFSAQLGHTVLVYTMDSSIYFYFKEILGLDVDNRPSYLMIPYTFQYISAIMLGFLADHLINKDLVPVVYLRSIYTGGGNILSSTFLLFTAFTECSLVLAIGCFTGALMTKATIYPGLKANILDRTRHYAGVITAIENGLPALVSPLSTYLVNRIHVNHTRDEWQKAFWFSFVASFFSTVVYLLRNKAEKAPWDVVDTIAKPKLKLSQSKQI